MGRDRGEVVKKYKTKSGLPARIICDDAKRENRFVVIALVAKNGYEYATKYG